MPRFEFKTSKKDVDWFINKPNKGESIYEALVERSLTKKTAQQLAKVPKTKELVYQHILSLDKSMQELILARILARVDLIGEFFWQKRGLLEPCKSRGLLGRINGRFEEIILNKSPVNKSFAKDRYHDYGSISYFHFFAPYHPVPGIQTYFFKHNRKLQQRCKKEIDKKTSKDCSSQAAVELKTIVTPRN